jgi:hypothetical protein
VRIDSQTFSKMDRNMPATGFSIHRKPITVTKGAGFQCEPAQGDALPYPRDQVESHLVDPRRIKTNRPHIICVVYPQSILPSVILTIPLFVIISTLLILCSKVSNTEHPSNLAELRVSSEHTRGRSVPC